MKPFDSYLTRVARELRSMPPSKRDDELRELRSHLEQRSEDFVRGGLSSEDAQTRALEEFGSPRELGINLYEAWEAGPLTMRQLLSAIGRVTFFWLCTTFQLVVGIAIHWLWAESVLFPELTYIVPVTAFCVPFGCGWLWSHCLGNRRKLVSLLFITVTFDLLFLSASFSYLNGWGWDWTHPTTEPFYNVILAFNPLLAVAGTYLTNALRQRRGHLALASGQTMSATSSRFSKWNTQRIQLCVALMIGIGWWRHIHTTFSPSDPISVLQTSLLLHHRPNSNGDLPIEPPIILEMRELPPATPAEKAGLARRVSFQVEMRADRGTAQDYADYFKSQLPRHDKHTPEVENRMRQSIATLRRNSQTFKGVARLVQTSTGWKVDERSFQRSTLWAWFYTAMCPSEANAKIPQ